MSYRLLTRGVLRLADNLVVTRDMAEWAEYRQWIIEGNIPLAMETPSPAAPTLAEVKATKIRQIKDGALAAVNVHLPDATDVSTLILLKEVYLSIAPAARQPTAAMTRIINIYQTMQTAMDAVRACDTAACVDSVNPIW